jgi:hypothetical protein
MFKLDETASRFNLESMKLQSEGESIETYPHKKDPNAKKTERAWMRTVPLSVEERGVISI